MNLKSKSIKRKILLAIVCTLIIQDSLFVLTINRGNVINEIKNNAFLGFETKVNEESILLQTQMENYWANLASTQEEIIKYIERFVYNKNILPEEINKNEEISSVLLEEISEKLVFILKKNYVTGAYIILDTQNSEGNSSLKNGIYIKDLNPENTVSGNFDLLLCLGNKDLGKKLQITRAPQCIEKYDFTKEQWNYNEILQKPIELSKRNVDNIEKGYWGKHVKLCGAQSESITYSVPLVDSNKNVYGVLGIEIANNYISTEMEKYINSENLDSFVLGYSSSSNSEFESLVVFNEKNENINIENKNIKIGKSINKDIYEIQLNNDKNKSLYACIKPLSLKGDETENGKWIIAGINEKEQLFYHYNRVRHFVYVSVLISTVFGIISSIIFGNRVTNPIKKLVGQVRTSNPRKPMNLEATQITEIDELSKEIMDLSVKSLDSASKLSQIIELLNMSIGAFEYKIEDDEVFCTKGFFGNLGIDTEYYENRNIDVLTFDLIMEELLQNPDKEKNVYILKINDEEKYIELNLKNDGEKILGVINDITKDVLKRKQIEHERDYDSLTGLINRIAFRKITTHKLQKRNNNIGAFVMIDLDSLKYVNDTYGHDLGDSYIKKAGDVLKDFNGKKCIVSRRSGDEFLVFIYGYSDKNGIRKVVEEMRNKMINTILELPNNNFQKIRASFGIAWYPYDSVNYEELSRYSDFAMYRSKRTIKGSIYEFNKKEYEKQFFLLSKKEELNKLIEEELVQYAFQPIIDINTGKIFAYEALMRSKLETIENPFQIIQIATQESKLYEIERLTFFKSIETFKEKQEYFGDARLFINSIPNEMLSDRDIIKIENEYGEFLSRLVVELLENEQSNSTNSGNKIKKIKAWNAELAIDDFGSGYNNEAVLLNITPKFVKIDMDIVQGVEFDMNRREIIKNLTNYAKLRDIKVIAEGIETKEQLQCVAELGVDYAQGYYFSKPQFIPPKLTDDIIIAIKEINKKKQK